MPRPPGMLPEEKTRLLAILAGEMSIAEAARRAKGVRAVGVELEAPSSRPAARAVAEGAKPGPNARGGSC